MMVQASMGNRLKQAVVRHAAGLSIVAFIALSGLAFYLSTHTLADGVAQAAAPAGLRSWNQAEQGRAADSRLVALPDYATLAPGEAGPVQRDYRWRLQLDAPLHDQALYWHGLAAHARVTLNGQVIHDGLADALQPLPRSVDRIVLMPVPDAFWEPGENLLLLQAAGPRSISVSMLELGPRPELAERRQDRVTGVVVAPGVVAAVVGTLGLCMLLLWWRLHEPLHGYFGAGCVAWALHSAWSVMPWPSLFGEYWLVGWISLYTFFVNMLVIFCMRFAGWRGRRFERLLWLACAAAPVVLYSAALLDALQEAAELWRLGMIAMVSVGVTAIFSALLRRRSADNALIAVTGLVCLLFALHDWIVANAGFDNNPVYWVPFAGLLFVVVVVRVLIDRLVRASRQIEGMNSELERRVAAQHAELRDALARMRAARDAAESADRAKTSFLAAASHDLRQPAHALGLYMASLQLERLDERQAELVQRMSGSLAALDTMFDALLDVSRIDAGGVLPQPRPFALEALLRRLAEEFAPETEARGLRLSLRLPPAAGGAMALSDPLLVERILRNLLANAIKYTASGGVLLACRARRAPGDNTAGTAAVGGPGAATRQWRVEVWDTGLGIAPAEQERVFEEFYQVGNPGRDRSGGLGLGLSIVRRLADLLGLQLQLCSRPGRGSCFAIKLSMADGGEPAALQTPRTTAAEAPAPARPTALHQGDR